MLQMRPVPFIFQYGNAHCIPGGRVPDNLCGSLRHEVLEEVQQSVSQDTITRRICPVYLKSGSDEDYSYIDEGNPSGSDLDDLLEWGLEDNIIRRSTEEARSSGSVQEDVNDLVLQDTIIRNHDDPEPEGTGYSCTNAHACDQEMLQMRPDPFIFQYGNAHYIPAGSVHDNVCGGLHREVLEDVQQSVSQDTIARSKSPGEEKSPGIGYFLTD